MSQRNAGFLLQHMMMKQLKTASSFVSGIKHDRISDKDTCGNVQMSETKIYIGLNDADTREQKYETEQYLNMLKDLCKKYHLAFSVDIEEGGYYHEDGEYTEETSLVLVLIDADRDIVQKIAKDLCEFFHQESVLVTENSVNGYFIR